MKKDTLYLLTFLSICLIVIAVFLLGTNAIARISTSKLIETQLKVGERETTMIAAVIGNEINEKIPREQIKSQIQKKLSETNTQTSFISVFDWSGKFICHPNITKLGQSMETNTTTIAFLKEEYEGSSFYEILFEKNENKNAPVLHIQPVPNSDWIVAAHIDIDKVTKEHFNLKKSFYLTSLYMGLAIIFLCFFVVRVIGAKYEQGLRLKKDTTQLSQITSKTSEQNEKIKSSERNNLQEDSMASTKNFLTSRKNEIVPVSTENIGLIYTENTITYIVCKDGSTSTINDSLDELYSKLDKKYFYRANRKFIIEISTIGKIIKFGNSQLKIIFSPDDSFNIIVSKNKAADFKKWLN